MIVEVNTCIVTFLRALGKNDQNMGVIVIWLDVMGLYLIFRLMGDYS